MPSTSRTMEYLRRRLAELEAEKQRIEAELDVLQAQQSARPPTP